MPAERRAKQGAVYEEQMEGYMSLTDKSIGEFALALSSKAPTPGGGGASALVGALGAALGIMVGELTVGKKKYADVEEDLRALMAEAAELRDKLLREIDKDAEVFGPLAEAYSIPKEDPKRAEVMEKCLRDACAVPMDIMRLSCRAIELQQGFAEKGSALVISDAGTGVVFCWAALYGGALNVRVNTRLMADRAYAEKLNAEVDAMMEQYWKLAADVYDGVMERLK